MECLINVKSTEFSKGKYGNWFRAFDLDKIAKMVHGKESFDFQILSDGLIYKVYTHSVFETNNAKKAHFRARSVGPVQCRIVFFTNWALTRRCVRGTPPCKRLISIFNGCLHFYIKRIPQMHTLFRCNDKMHLD